MEDQYEFSEIKASIDVPKKSLEEIVDIANDIWKEIKSSPEFKNDKQLDDLLKVLQDKYADFNNGFPIILRWMVQMRKYDRDAFKKYLMKHSTAELKTREDFLILQAEYLVFMFRNENKHIAENKIKEYRDYIIKMLLDEDKEFVKITKEVEKQFELDKKEKIEKIYNLLNKKT